MKYIKKFNEEVVHHIAIQNVGNTDDLEQCFDGISEIDVNDQPNKDILSLKIETKRSGPNFIDVLIKGRVDQERQFNPSKFILNGDILEEIESSVGKASELGYVLSTSFLYTVNPQPAYLFIFNLKEFEKYEGQEITGIRLCFTALNAHQQKIKKLGVRTFLQRSDNQKNESLSGKYDTELKSCFEGIEDLKPQYEDCSFRATELRLGGILIFQTSDRWTSLPFNMTDDIKDEIISSIGKAFELGYKVKSGGSLISIVSAGETHFSHIYNVEEFDNLNIDGERIQNILIYLNPPKKNI